MEAKESSFKKELKWWHLLLVAAAFYLVGAPFSPGFGDLLLVAATIFLLLAIVNLFKKNKKDAR